MTAPMKETAALVETIYHKLLHLLKKQPMYKAINFFFVRHYSAPKVQIVISTSGRSEKENNLKKTLFTRLYKSLNSAVQ